MFKQRDTVACVQMCESGAQTSWLIASDYMNFILKMPREIIEGSIAVTRTTITRNKAA